MRKKASAEEFLPLTPVVFEILLTLVDGERHGYAIMQEVERRTEGRVSLHPGTLYRAIGRMVSSGVIEELAERAADKTDQRRRYYRVSQLGRRVARAEAWRLAGQVKAARLKNLLPEIA